MTNYKQLIEEATEEKEMLEAELEELNEATLEELNEEEAETLKEEAWEIDYRLEELAREIEQLEDESEDYLFSGENEWKRNGLRQSDFY